MKSYKKKTVVNNLSFSVNRGEIFAFLGSNGAGKTTTIKMILGLVGIDSGEVKLAPNISIGYSPETPYFPPFLTGLEVLDYYAGIQKIAKSERKTELPKLLETVGLENDKTRVKNYSKGMLQRLALAQALIGHTDMPAASPACDNSRKEGAFSRNCLRGLPRKPDLLILDEPTAGLDALGRHEIMLLIEKLRASGMTIIINSHILGDIERICDRGIIIKRGVQMGVWSKADNNEKSLEEIFLDLVGGASV